MEIMEMQRGSLALHRAFIYCKNHVGSTCISKDMNCPFKILFPLKRKLKKKNWKFFFEQKSLEFMLKLLISLWNIFFDCKLWFGVWIIWIHSVVWEIWVRPPFQWKQKMRFFENNIQSSSWAALAPYVVSKFGIGLSKNVSIISLSQLVSEIWPVLNLTGHPVFHEIQYNVEIV